MPMDTTGAVIGVMFLMLVSAFVSIGVWQNSRRGMLREARKRLFGEQYAQIIQRKWKLEDLRYALDSPDESSLQQAMKECDEDLAKLDRAVVMMHAASRDAQEQHRIASHILRITQEQLAQDRLVEPEVRVVEDSVIQQQTHTHAHAITQ